MKQALEDIKKELGHDAFILGGKEVKGKKMMGLFGKSYFEVTAAVDYAGPMLKSPAGSHSESGSSAETKKPSLSDRIELDEIQDTFNFSFQAPGRSNLAMVARAAKASAAPRPLPATSEKRNDLESGALLEEIRQLRAIVQSLPRQAASLRPVAVLRSVKFAHPVYEEVFQELMARELDDDLARELIDAVIKERKSTAAPNKRQVLRKIAGCLSRRIYLSEEGLQLHQPGAQRILALVGPTGVGKTTTLAKLAARAVLEQRLKVGFVTVDTFRIAATEQLKTYAEIIDVPTRVVENLRDISCAIAELADRDLILIDTAGRSPKETGSLQELAGVLNELPNLHKVLLLSATTKRSDLADIAERYSIFNPGSVIFTKLDETQVYGPVLSQLARSASPLAYLTVGQNVPKDIVIPDASRLAGLFEGLEGNACGEPHETAAATLPPARPSRKKAARGQNTLTQTEVNSNA